MSRYIFLSVVIVNRGQIEVGKRLNGSTITGQHKEYAAGIVVQDIVTYKRLFLDIFNSEHYIREYLRFNKLATDQNVMQIPLDWMLRTKEFKTIENSLNIVKVKDINKYIKDNALIEQKRDAEKMREMARCSCVLHL